MPFKLLDHQADVGLQATGATLGEALRDGVRGLLSIMVDPATVEPRQRVEIAASGTDPGSLYVDLLNAVLVARDIHGMFFHDIIIDSVREDPEQWNVAATLSGDVVDLERHEVDAEVKAATYGGLLVQHDEQGWMLRCVLDL